MVCSAGIGPDERLQALARRGLQPIRERFRLCPLHLNIDAKLCAYDCKDDRKVMGYLFRFAALDQ